MKEIPCHPRKVIRGVLPFPLAFALIHLTSLGGIGVILAQGIAEACGSVC